MELTNTDLYLLSMGTKGLICQLCDASSVDYRGSMHLNMLKWSSKWQNYVYWLVKHDDAFCFGLWTLSHLKQHEYITKMEDYYFLNIQLAYNLYF